MKYYLFYGQAVNTCVLADGLIARDESFTGQMANVPIQQKIETNLSVWLDNATWLIRSNNNKFALPSFLLNPYIF